MSTDHHDGGAFVEMNGDKGRKLGKLDWIQALSRRTWTGKQLPYYHSLMTIGTFANSSPPMGNAYPGEERLASLTGRDVRTVRRHLAQGVQDGWLEKVRQGSQQSGRASEYRLTFPFGSGA